MEKDQTIERNDQANLQHNHMLREKDEAIAKLRQEVRQLEREKDLVIEVKERELGHKLEEIDRLKKENWDVSTSCWKRMNK